MSNLNLRIPELANLLTNLPKMEMPEIGISPVVENALENKASKFCEKLADIIRQFQNQIDEQCEVGMRLVTFGQAVVIHVEAIGYYDPSLVRFRGKTGDGAAVELVQHVSQINFLLTVVPKLNPEEPSRPIGFIQPE